MKKSYIIEAIIFVIFLFLFLYFGIKSFNHFFDIGKTYQVTFHDIDGIVVGSPVRIMGVDVGNVKKVTNNFDEIKVSFIIYDNQIPIPDGTLATIEFSGLAGSRSIELYPPHSNVSQSGFKLEEPIRIGDAIDIMGKLGDAMMKSVAGIFEFAKSRPQSQFNSETRALLDSTKNTKVNIINYTDKIASADTRLQKRFSEVESLGEKTIAFAQKAEKLPDFNSYSTFLKFSNRNLGNFNKDLKNMGKDFHKKSSVMKTKTDLFNNNYSFDFDRISSSVNFIENSLYRANEMLDIENIDKIKNKTEEFKKFSQDLDNSF